MQKRNHKNMPTLPFKISKAEIDKLSYERYAYPQPMVQKRIFAVYLKMEFNYDKRLIGLITGLHSLQHGYFLDKCVQRKRVWRAAD